MEQGVGVMGVITGNVAEVGQCSFRGIYLPIGSPSVQASASPVLSHVLWALQGHLPAVQKLF